MIEASEIQKEDVVEPDGPPALKLDLACGDNKLEGFHGVDLVQTPSADTVFDLKQTPWPWGEDSVGEARCSHFLEHLEPVERIEFMNELWRVLQPGAGCLFITPLGYERQVQDFSHRWPPIVTGSFLYFDEKWLELNKLTHYRELHGITCDFEVRPMEIGVTPEFANRQDEHKIFAARHYMNAATDLVVLLVKRKEKEKEP